MSLLIVFYTYKNFIKFQGVSLNERGIYTCYCKHLMNTTYNAKSVMLEVKSDWKQLWENDEVGIFKLKKEY